MSQDSHAIDNGMHPAVVQQGKTRQIDSSLFSRLDLRVSKAIALGESRKIELIGQVFNVLGRDNLGGLSTFYNTNVRSDAFGRIQAAQPRQQGEVAVRFVF